MLSTRNESCFMDSQLPCLFQVSYLRYLYVLTLQDTCINLLNWRFLLYAWLLRWHYQHLCFWSIWDTSPSGHMAKTSTCSWQSSLTIVTLVRSFSVIFIFYWAAQVPSGWKGNRTSRADICFRWRNWSMKSIVQIYWLQCLESSLWDLEMLRYDIYRARF